MYRDPTLSHSKSLYDYCESKTDFQVVQVAVMQTSFPAAHRRGKSLDTDYAISYTPAGRGKDAFF